MSVSPDVIPDTEIVLPLSVYRFEYEAHYGYPLKAGQIEELQHCHCSGIEVLAAQIV